MGGGFLLVFTYCTLVVVHDQSDSIPDSILDYQLYPNTSHTKDLNASCY